MNIQPGRAPVRKNARSSSRSAQVQDSGLLSWFTSICKAGLLLGAIVGFFYSYITLNQQIGVTERAINKTKEEIKQTEREYDARRNLYASRCNISYIRRQIARFNLPLYTAQERQQHKLTLLTAQEIARRPLITANRNVAFSEVVRNTHSRRSMR